MGRNKKEGSGGGTAWWTLREEWGSRKEKRQQKDVFGPTVSETKRRNEGV